MKILESSVSILLIAGILCQNSVQPTLAIKSPFRMPNSMSVRFSEEAIVEANLNYIQSLDAHASSWLYSQLNGRVGRTARPNAQKKEIETKIERGLIKRGVSDEYAAILAYSFVRLQPGSLGRLAVWKVLDPADLEAFESDRLDDKSYNHIEIGLTEVANGYKESNLTPVQTMRALSRIIPYSVFKDIQSATRIASATLAEAVERHADFDVWVPAAHQIVLEIAPDVGGSAAAWKIVLQQGISRAKVWVLEAQQTVRLLTIILRGTNNAWKFVIAVGRERAVPTAIQFVLRDLVEEFGSINAVATRGDLTFRLANQGLRNPDRLTSRGQRKLLVALEALVKDRISDARFQRALEKAIGASGSHSALARRSVVSAPTVTAIVSGKASAKSRYRLWPAIRRTRTWQMEELVRLRKILVEMSEESPAEIARRTGLTVQVIARVLTWDPAEGALHLFKSSRRAIRRFLEYRSQSTKSLGTLGQGNDYPDFALPEERLQRFMIQNPLPVSMDWPNFKIWYLANADGLANVLWEGRHPGMPRPRDYTLSPAGVGAILYKAHFISKQLHGMVSANGSHFYYALTHATILMLQIRQALLQLNPRDITTHDSTKLRDALRPMMDPASLIRARDEGTLRDIEALRQAHSRGLDVLEASKSTGIGIDWTQRLWLFVVETQHFTPRTYAETPDDFRTLMTEALTLPPVQGIVQEWASQPPSAWHIGWLRDITEWIMWKIYLLKARGNPKLKVTAQLRAKQWTDRNIERVEEAVRWVIQLVVTGLIHRYTPIGSLMPGPDGWILSGILALAVQSLAFAFFHFGENRFFDEDWKNGFWNRAIGGVILTFIWLGYPVKFPYDFILWIAKMPGRIRRGENIGDGFKDVFASRAVGLHQLNNHWIDIGGNAERIRELPERDQILLSQLTRIEDSLFGWYRWGARDSGDPRLRNYTQAARRLTELLYRKLQTLGYQGTALDREFWAVLAAYYQKYLSTNKLIDPYYPARFTVPVLSEGRLPNKRPVNVTFDEARRCQIVAEILHWDPKVAYSDILLDLFTANYDKTTQYLLFNALYGTQSQGNPIVPRPREISLPEIASLLEGFPLPGSGKVARRADRYLVLLDQRIAAKEYSVPELMQLYEEIRDEKIASANMQDLVNLIATEGSVEQHKAARAWLVILRGVLKRDYLEPKEPSPQAPESLLRIPGFRNYSVRINLPHNIHGRLYYDTKEKKPALMVYRRPGFDPSRKPPDLQAPGKTLRASRWVYGGFPHTWKAIYYSPNGLKAEIRRSGPRSNMVFRPDDTDGSDDTFDSGAEADKPGAISSAPPNVPALEELDDAASEQVLSRIKRATRWQEIAGWLTEAWRAGELSFKEGQLANGARSLFRALPYLHITSDLRSVRTSGQLILGDYDRYATFGYFMLDVISFENKLTEIISQTQDLKKAYIQGDKETVSTIAHQLLVSVERLGLESFPHDEQEATLLGFRRFTNDLTNNLTAFSMFDFPAQKAGPAPIVLKSLDYFIWASKIIPVIMISPFFLDALTAAGAPSIRMVELPRVYAQILLHEPPFEKSSQLVWSEEWGVDLGPGQWIITPEILKALREELEVFGATATRSQRAKIRNVLPIIVEALPESARDLVNLGMRRRTLSGPKKDTGISA